MFRSIVNASRITLRNVSVVSSATRVTPGYINKQAPMKSAVRFYSAAPELTREIIAERIVELLQAYSKTAEDITITDSTSFSKDLGYDSLDTAEVIMEIEHEFSILIPDKEADEIKTVGQAIDYIQHQDDAC
ncbi:acyl carrier protein [Pichia kudriavzevii]|uniref:Acyl carrier protein n=1 Tax=Pichia kudriavzevii TaxID=4909 RepID=A0A099P845_PICKU|nr:uncharacterized protein C5L36_0C02225 [Pichia kudriavzevii]AWU76278.1 hypothetical protein C5L36_0C02225 [Pichia kudriavzevii]KGK40384.1 hypothetical protein JL09_g494 [Pichia kudriavzevii]OUT23856.1 acyl carrier protein [Pichia kudriavzevii]